MKVAIVGCGRMGERFVQIAKKMEFELAGICDQRSEAVQKLIADHGLPVSTGYTNLSELLRDKRPEMVVVATTAQVHHAYTLEAAAAGASHIVCEKPMAVSIQQCDEMIAACAKRGTKLAINHQMRFMEQYTLPKQLLGSPEFGGVTSVNVMAGNFGLAMNGSHYFEVFRYLTDENPCEVSAWFSRDTVPNPRGTQFVDRGGCMRMITPTGKRFYMDCSTDQGHGLHVVYGARNGRIVIDELMGKVTTVLRKREHFELPTTRYAMPDEEKSFTIQPADVLAPTEAVIRALLEGKNYPSGEDARRAIMTLVACYVSSEKEGAPVRIDETLPKDRIFPWA